MKIQVIESSQTHRLRQKVLRPHQCLEEMVYPNDDHALSYHVGGFASDRLVAVASLYREGLAGEVDTQHWRLRGMAVEDSAKGKGFGRRLLENCIAHASQKGGTSLWCNARASALGFYERMGFWVDGEPFDIDGIGLHYVMRRSLS